MDINSLRGNLSTISDIVFSCGTVIDVRSCFVFFFTQRPFQTSVVFLTIHDTMLSARGTLFCFCLMRFFFAMASNAVDTMIFFAVL